jgi:hypothetical protein
MKKLLLAVVLAGLVRITSAGTTNIYTQDWGTTNGGGSLGSGTSLGTVGWANVSVAPNGAGGPYLGFYQAAGASDAATGVPLPVNTVYFTTLTPNQSLPVLIYTTDTSGAGTAGDSAFADINPTLYTNLTLSAETRGGATDTNYFAVQLGASWYVCTSYQMPSYNGGPPYGVFTNASLIYTNPANVWQSLTLGTTNVTIGAVASPNLSATITGLGIVQLPTGGGFDYNQLAITALAASAPPPVPPTVGGAVSPQNVFVGGGASFAVAASGTKPLTYIWESNGVPLPAGDRYLGLNTATLTITNITADDASIIYSVIVTNIAGAATNSGLTLNVSPVPNDLLYAELFPYIGPTGSGNLPITGTGWAFAASGNTGVGIYQDQGTGAPGDVFSYAPTATTNIYYTTDTNDVGPSGLPFVDINPNNFPAVWLQAGFVPGNGAGQVSGAISVYWAVSMNGVWYCTTQPVPISLGAQGHPFQTNQFQFNPAATNWNNLTITASGAVIGSQASGALTGNITGAGLVVAHNTSTGSDMNFQNFEIVTNATISPPGIGTDIPLAVTVAAGGGASFGVSATGTQPFFYAWTTNNVLVHNGGRVSGANTATLTIANLTTNDNNMSIVAFITNSAGTAESDTTYGATTLTVTNPSVGVIYSEAFPFVGPVPGNYPLSSLGWAEGVPGQPNALFQVTALTSTGAAFAYLGSAGTTVYYTTTASDTNQAGLPFPNVNLASYPSLNFSVDLAPTYSSSNVTAYIAVQLAGTNWYMNASPLPVPTASDSGAYATYTMAFDPTAANWKQLTVTSSGGLIGATAASNLSGIMTGAGLVFVTVGSGGNFNFQNFAINGAGLGGINVGPLTNNKLSLSWVGNPAVELQSVTNLNSTWQDMPGTYGLYSLSVSNKAPQQFFRLKSP